MRRHHAEWHRHADRDQHGEEGQRQRRLNALADQRGDRLLEEEAFAEIAGQHPARPDDELLQHRLVKAELLADLRDLLAVGAIAGKDRRRIRRRQPQHQENKDRYDQHHGNGAEQSPEQVAIHRHGLLDLQTARAEKYPRPRRSNHLVSSMFQNTGAGAMTKPLTFLRIATGCTYSPTGISGVVSMARTCTASAIAFCLAGSVSRAKSSRSFSSSASHGQPNSALSHDEFR